MKFKRSLARKIKDSDSNRAFTLVEIMVVLSIILLLSSIVMNSLAQARMLANDAKVISDLRQVRIAAELYYTEYHSYPLASAVENKLNQNIASNLDFDGINIDQENNPIIYEQKDAWSNKLSFFTKTAKAARLPVIATCSLCAKFTSATKILVDNKYLSVMPVHPYDNVTVVSNGFTTKVAGYKAVNNSKSFAVYGILTKIVETPSGSFQKRAGFILGDTSVEGFSSLNASTTISGDSINKLQTERGYPAGPDGISAPTDISNSIDYIEGITEGAISN